MSMGIKVAELNTLSDGQGITGIRFFNEMEDTNESKNLRKLANVWMQRIVAVWDIATEALSASIESLLTSDIPVKKKKLNHIVFRSQICRKVSVFTKLHGHKTIEVEFRIRVERPLLPRSR